MPKSKNKSGTYLLPPVAEESGAVKHSCRLTSTHTHKRRTYDHPQSAYRRFVNAALPLQQNEDAIAATIAMR